MLCIGINNLKKLHRRNIFGTYKGFKDNPEKYELQLPQQFVSQYINPDTPYKGVLVYHRIGAGKTCTAIRIGEEWKGKKKIIVVLPASLKGNFRSELRSQCANDDYLTNKEKQNIWTYLKYINI